MTPQQLRDTRDPELRLVEPAEGTEMALQDVFGLLEELPTAVLVLDARGVVLHVNPIAELRLDRTRAELQGHDLFREVFPHLEEEGLGPRYRATLDAGRVAIGHETELPTADGPRKVTLGVRSYGDAQRRVGVLLIEDRTALSREKGRRERAERLAAVGELAEAVAHEINNPLASIKSFAQLLVQDAVDEESQQGLEVIARETTRIARTVDRLLQFAEQQASHEREAVSLTELAAGVLDLKRYVLQTAGIEVRTDFDPAVSLVRLQRGVLQRVLLQLLNHAERTLTGSEGARQLVVQTRETTDGVVLTVVDNGPGVPRERLPALLRPSQAEPRGEVDLGLCALLIREQGGRMWAESVQGRGTAFFVQFPRVQDRPEPRPGLMLDVLDAQDAGAQDEPEPARPRVLVVDDEASLRLAISLFLRRRGYEVVQAASAARARDLAREQRFQLALVDARVGGGGPELLEALDASPGLRGRTVLLSADPGRARRRGELDRVYPTLVKPFDMDDLLHTVETLAR